MDDQPPRRRFSPEGWDEGHEGQSVATAVETPVRGEVASPGTGVDAPTIPRPGRRFEPPGGRPYVPEPETDPLPDPIELPEPSMEELEEPEGRVPTWVWLGLILALATFVRLWQINALGYNSDEAVYSGQGASIAGVDALEPYFPAFRAHPLLTQTILALGYKVGGGEIFGRVLIALVGVLTVFVVYKLGRLLYGRQAGLVAALFMALMPYHVIVTRQVLLDGPMTLCATLTLYALAQYATTRRLSWLYASGAAMGLTFLAKETGILLLGSIYAFFALVPALRVRVGQLARALGVMACFLAVFPIALILAGKTSTGGNFLAWQLFRRPNHGFDFYFLQVPPSLGLLLVAVTVFGLWRLRAYWNWKETLLFSWIVVPTVFFELWAVKGFQYLLPIAPAVAVLGARSLTATWAWEPFSTTRGRFSATLARAANRMRLRRYSYAAIAIVAGSLAISTWGRIEPSDSATFLAGSGGVPGGRETGEWIGENVPEGARMMTIGPSMANIVEFYGRRQANGLSVSPNPLNRNPVYDPLVNPDRMIRDNELQYLVWDAFSAERSPFFAKKLLTYADRYNGRVVHTETVPVTTSSGEQAQKPIITVYEVRP